MEQEEPGGKDTFEMPGQPGSFWREGQAPQGSPQGLSSGLGAILSLPRVTSD